MLRTSTSLLAASAAIVTCSPALAADFDHLNVNEPERPPYLQRKAGERFTLPPIAPESTTPPPAGATLERVVFQGNTVISTAELEAIAAPYLGRPAGAAEFEELRQKVSRLYVDRGYINSGALLPVESFAQGTLTLQIVEGRLKEVRLAGLERLHEQYVVSRLTRADEALNIVTLGERFQWLLTDPLFARLSGQLLPSEQRGLAVLHVDVERARPYQLSLYANNYQPVSVGPAAATLAGWVRNLTGYGDVLEASIQEPLFDGQAQRDAISWRMPLHASGTSLLLAYDRGTSSVIEQPTRDLDIRSRPVNKEIGLAQPLFESLTQKLSIGLSRVWRENRTWAAGERFSFVAGTPHSGSKANDWRFWQEYAWRAENQVLALRSTFTFGRNNQDEDLAPFGPAIDKHYRIWLGQAQYARRVLDNGTQLLLRLNVQQTPDRLIPIEQMAVGGIYTVRGYRENQLVRDKGVVANVEVDFPLLADGASGLRLNVAPFYDYGRARNQDQDAATIASFGVAGKLRWYGLAVDLAVARKVHYSNTDIGKTENLQDKGIHLQVSYNFF